MKVVKKSDIPTEVRFLFTQLVLGDISQDFAVVADDLKAIYYIGTLYKCQSYLERTK